MTLPGSGPPPGWYPDPAGSGGARWWDGYRWTDHLSGRAEAARATWAGVGPGPGPGPAWRPTGPDLPGLLRDEQRAAPWARGAVAAYGLISIASLALVVAHYGGSYDSWRHFFHQVHTAVQAGRSAPPLPSDLAFPADLLVPSLLSLVPAVLWLVWQYRVADAARRLGLPARHSPGWGVAFWFIPVANLFCPYQAIRDCLPPQDPARPRVLHFWLLYLLSGVAALTCEVTSIFDRPAGFALVAVAAVLWAIVAAMGVGIIDRIGAAHQAIAGP